MIKMAGVSLISGGGMRLVAQTSFVPGIPPMLILLLCIIAGIGTLLLLPTVSVQRTPFKRNVGGLFLTLSLLTLAVWAIHGSIDNITFGFDATGVGNPYFWIFSIIAIAGAIRVVTHPRPVYSALYFVLTVFASAGLFVLLAADFIAAALILIYAGAILITYVFVIMLAAQATSGPATGALAGLAEYDLESREPFVASCVGFALMGLIIFLVFDKADGLVDPQQITESAAGQILPASVTNDPGAYGSTQALGAYLFRHQLINVELAGLILTLSMIGAIIIARRKIVDTNLPFGTPAEEVLGPATPINDDPHSIPVYGTRNPEQKAYPET